MSKSSLLLSVLLHAGALAVLGGLSHSGAAGPDVAGGSGGEGGGGMVIGIRSMSMPVPAPEPPTVAEAPAGPREALPAPPPAIPAEPGPEPGEPPTVAEAPAGPGEALAAVPPAPPAEPGPEARLAGPSPKDPQSPEALNDEGISTAGRVGRQPAAPPLTPAPTPNEPLLPQSAEPSGESRGDGPEAAAGAPGLEGAGPAEPGSLRPVYPARCRRLGHRGVVVVRLVVDADGKARRAEVSRSAGCPDLDRAALEAVLRARFRPARRWGKPVESAIEQPFRFEFEAR